MQVTKSSLPRRQHSQYRKVKIELDFVWMNPNPPHIFDCTDKNLEDRLAALISKNLPQTIWLDVEKGSGMIHRDFVEKDTEFGVTVSAMECGDQGKPLTLWQKVKYWLLGRRYI